MRSLKTLTLLVAACCCSSVAYAQLQLLPDKESQRVFSGEARKIAVVWRNIGDRSVDIELRRRLIQTSSATAVQLGGTPWKELQVLPGQTIVESIRLDFPAVRGVTRFLVQWLEDTNAVVGSTEVLVYPPDLLKELKPLTGGEPVGVFDPNSQLKPLLKTNAVEFQDLEDAGLESFQGRLAVIGPFQSKAQMRDGLPDDIDKLVRKGAAVVWIQPPKISSPSSRRDPIKPSFYAVSIGKGTVVIVQADLISDLPEDPKAQLNLIQFARLALHPEPLRLPFLTPQP